MKEKIYTIPVNDAFDDPSGGCPFCLLHSRLEEEQLGLILGASMMEDDVRTQTNEKGFCPDHLSKLAKRGNRLGLALILESHLETLKGRIAPGGFFASDKSARPKKELLALEKSCYICERTENNFDAILGTSAYLYAKEKEFKAKFANAKSLCLPHYRRVLEAAGAIPKPYSADMAADAGRIVAACLDKLKDDISWFCKKFDYRYEEEPWYDAKDAIERAVTFLTGM